MRQVAVNHRVVPLVLIAEHRSADSRLMDSEDVLQVFIDFRGQIN